MSEPTIASTADLLRQYAAALREIAALRAEVARLRTQIARLPAVPLDTMGVWAEGDDVACGRCGLLTKGGLGWYRPGGVGWPQHVCADARVTYPGKGAGE